MSILMSGSFCTHSFLAGVSETLLKKWNITVWGTKIDILRQFLSNHRNGSILVLRWLYVWFPNWCVYMSLFDLLSIFSFRSVTGNLHALINEFIQLCLHGLVQVKKPLYGSRKKFSSIMYLSPNFFNHFGSQFWFDLKI